MVTRPLGIPGAHGSGGCIGVPVYTRVYRPTPSLESLPSRSGGCSAVPVYINVYRPTPSLESLPGRE